MRYKELFEYAMKLPVSISNDVGVSVNPGPEEFDARISQSPYNAVRFLIDNKLYIWNDDTWHITIAVGLGLGNEMDHSRLLTGYFTENGYYLNEHHRNEILLNHPMVLKMLNGKTLVELDDIP